MDTPIKGIFPNIHTARRLLNPPKWTPPLGPNDPTFPSTPSQDVYIVREIHAALRESGPFWRSGGAHVAYRQCGLLKLPRVLQTGDGGFADAWLEAVAWEALVRWGARRRGRLWGWSRRLPLTGRERRKR